jgi:hypothetical protein
MARSSAIGPPYPDFAFPPTPDRVGEGSIKVTTQSPRLTSKVRRTFTTNGQEPRNTSIRSNRR